METSAEEQIRTLKERNKVLEAENEALKAEIFNYRKNDADSARIGRNPMEAEGSGTSGSYDAINNNQIFQFDEIERAQLEQKLFNVLNDTPRKPPRTPGIWLREEKSQLESLQAALAHLKRITEPERLYIKQLREQRRVVFPAHDYYHQVGRLPVPSFDKLDATKTQSLTDWYCHICDHYVCIQCGEKEEKDGGGKCRDLQTLLDHLLKRHSRWFWFPDGRGHDASTLETFTTLVGKENLPGEAKELNSSLLGLLNDLLLTRQCPLDSAICSSQDLQTYVPSRSSVKPPKEFKLFECIECAFGPIR